MSVEIHGLRSTDKKAVGMLIDMIKSKKLKTRFPTLAENVADWADAAGVKNIDYWVHDWFKIPRMKVQDVTL